MPIATSVGLSRITASEYDAVLGTADTFNKKRAPLIYCHGAGDTTLTVLDQRPDPTGNPSQKALVEALACDFTVGVADLGGDQWGNNLHVARIGAQLDYLAANYGANRPAVLVAGSMGTLGALAFTLAFPARVRLVVAVLPALDLQDLLSRGAAAGINAAYGGAYNDATDGPTHSPVKFAAALPAGLPIALFTCSDDAIAVPATADAFVAARPQTYRENLGALGHTEAAIGAAFGPVRTWLRKNA